MGLWRRRRLRITAVHCLGYPANASHRGTRIPRSRCYKSMNFNGDGGPARTRTWDQGIMSTRVRWKLSTKAEEGKVVFGCSSRAGTPTEPIPNARPETGCVSHRKIDPVHRVAYPNRPNRAEPTRSVAPGVGEGQDIAAPTWKSENLEI
jgi:hypothetical protein